MERILAGSMFSCVLLNILFYLQSLLNLFFASVKTGSGPEKLKQQQGCVQHHDKEHHERLNQADIKLVMNRLGLEFHEDGSVGDEGFGADELLSLFEEEEPGSLEEVKEVFDVFDENKDGFIDARELNRVMCRLGLKEGIQVEECSRMIRAVGEDRKEKIDFNDFFRFMERFSC
uniref:EF-hand domain-containing protein n=1 Tax=Salix viminalis TaxID=40686 RepID=A0A6N2LRN0_SALVM